VLTGILLLLAGTFSYWQAWVFAAVNIVLVIATASRFGSEVTAIRERMRFTAATLWWDRLFLALFMPMNLILIVLAGLDAGRIDLSPEPLAILYPFFYILYVGAAFLHLWAVSTNLFYVGTVRILDGHSVIDEGPYRWVRHPGYTGIIVMMTSIAIVLGSVAALAPAFIITLLVIFRTLLEDRMLQRELEGYSEYCRRVRYRLVPGIW
jgi:protein-S-isoprenylcysteine O-methyltransferase Ste14